MKKKIICIFGCMLLIAATVLPVAGTMNNNKISTDTRHQELDNLNNCNIMASWIEKAKLTASDGANNDFFGFVSVCGDYAVIGAYGDDNANGVAAGSAYVFKRTGTSWAQEAKLLASDGATVDAFGYSVSIDGDYAIIGAYRDDNANGVDAGSAYVFKRTGTSWTQEAKLLASSGAAGDEFARSVSICGDTVVIGSYGDDSSGVDAGSAYVFKRTGTSWAQEAKLLASDGAAGDNLGFSVSIDGDYAIAGAYCDDNANGADAGSAYVFKRTGTSWAQEAKLLASDGATGDGFGFSVSIYGDYAVIGTPYDDGWRGSAYIFKRTGTSWAQEAKLTVSSTIGDWFGCSVSISGDIVIIGANGESPNGAAYIFKRTGTSWSQEAKLLASDGAAGDNFGCSVSIDGIRVIVGASSKNALTGAAYIFEQSNQPPNTPTITGPLSGTVGTSYTYTFTSTDPDGDQVSYYVEWGDTTNTGWFGPFASGTPQTKSHTWSTQGTYIIQAKAKDTNGAESGWGSLTITMPRNKAIQNIMFLQFIEEFPLLQRLLQSLGLQ